MPITLDAAIDKTAKLYRRLNDRRTLVQTTDDYYRGKQKLRFASDKWREYHADRYRDFADNWCAPVANSPAERIRLDGFRLDDDPEQSPDEKLLWLDWLRNDMDAQSSQGFLASIIGTRSYVLVWGDDDDEPVATWERPDQVIVEYDIERPGRRIAALKTWVEDDLEFATLYLPDELWKLQRQRVGASVDRSALPVGARGYEFFESTSGLTVAAGSPDSGWRLRDGDATHVANPMGVVPIVEFPNRPMLGGEPLSDISGTIAMQDAINLLWAYAFTAADFASMPARVVLGQEPPKIPILDESGQKVGEQPVDIKKLAEDRILWLTGQNTKVDQWDAAKLDVFTSVIETCVTHIAAQTRTPPHYLVLGKGMVNVNADGMRAAETGLVKKVEEAQLFFSPPAREVFRLFALVRDDKRLADACRFGVVQWKNAENRSQAQLVDGLQKLGAIGFPFRWLAEQYGLSLPEITRLMEMREAEAQADPIAALARRGAAPPDQPTAEE